MHSISFTVCSENTVWIGSEVENEVRDRERRKAIVIVVQGEKQEARVRNEFSFEEHLEKWNLSERVDQRPKINSQLKIKIIV